MCCVWKQTNCSWNLQLKSAQTHKYSVEVVVCQRPYIDQILVDPFDVHFIVILCDIWANPMGSHPLINFSMSQEQKGTRNNCHVLLQTITFFRSITMFQMLKCSTFRCEEYFVAYCQSHRTLLWIWIMLWLVDYTNNSWI